MSTLAFSYRRFSSKQQAKGHSLKRQSDAAAEYAAKHGLTLSEDSFSDLGISAFKGKNLLEGALGTFMNGVKSGVIAKGSYLLVESLDRVSREEVMAALQTFLSIVNSGIALVTLMDERAYTTEAINKNWTLIIEAVVTMARANEESATKSKRIRKSWNDRREKSNRKIITGVCPPWLTPNGDRTGFVPIAERAAIVQRIYKLALEGWGVQRMAKLFNSEPKVPRLKNATEWRAQEFVRLLKWEATKGVLMSVDGSYRNEDYYPKVIDPKDWGRVQAAMKSRSDKETGAQGRPSAGADNLFSRLFRCGVCGAGIRMTSRDRTNLRCLRAYSGADCSTPNYLYKPIEEEVLQLLLIDEHLDPLPQLGVTVDPSADIRAELEEKNALLAKYMEQFETANAPRPITLRINKITDEITSLEKQLREVVTPVPVHDAWVRAQEVWIELLRTDEEHVKWEQEGAKKGALDEYEEFSLERKVELRRKLQAGLRQLITRMNLLPRLYRAQLPVKYKNRDVRFYRKVEVTGPIVDMLKLSTKRKNEFTETGVLLDYTLPSYGSANYYREKEWEEQQNADVAALEAKHGIETGLVEKPKRKSRPKAA